MCGFSGVLRFDGAPVDGRALARMNQAIVHRGPDDGQVMVDGPMGLANRRLAILDLRPEAALPMTRGPLTVGFNGEIYNFARERTSLESVGHTFTTRGDTEVLLALYRQYGEAFVDHLDGMFAFALWDAEQQVLLLGRDAAGKKPLYYYQDAEKLVFGSEIKSILLHPGVPREARRDMLPVLLTYGCAPAPDTCYQGIFSLPPGELMVVRGGQVRKGVRTYGPRLTCTPGDGRPEDWTERIIDTLRESVRERLVSDVPLGAFLSGGVDSSLIVALMRELVPGRVRTFSVSFPDQETWDETPYARRVAALFDTEHIVLQGRPADVEEMLPQVVWHNDQPFGDESAVPTYLLSKMTRDYVTVALCGDAGDELFGGYGRFLRVQRAATGWPSKPGVRPLLRAVRQLCRPLGGAPLVGALAVRGWRLCDSLSQPMPAAYYRTLQITRQAKLRQLWQGELPVDPSVFYDHHFAGDSRDWLSRVLDFNYATYLHDDLLVKVDRMSMAASLEVRAPFLSDAMVRLASEIPTGLKVRHGVTKYILKEAARRYLPADIVDRPKRGFGLPLVHWFRTPRLQAYVRELLLDPVARGRGLYQPGAIETLLGEHVSGAWDHGLSLWVLCGIEHWYRMFIDPATLELPAWPVR